MSIRYKKTKIEKGAPMPLFDRLIDTKPQVKSEATVENSLNEETLKHSIAQELSNIFDSRIGSNVDWPENSKHDAVLLPEQFGIRDFAALTAQSESGKRAIASHVRAAILRFDRGELALQGDIRQSVQGIETKLLVQARSLRFSTFAHPERIRQLPAHDLDAQLSARGRSPRELAATLNGQLRLSGGPGETRLIGLERLLGSIGEQLLRTLNPYVAAEKVTRVECVAAGLRAVDGVVTLAPGYVARTDKVDIAATGMIDLTTEKLAVQFRNAPRKGIGVSAAGLVHPYVKLGGTLSQPTLVLDPPAALLSGGVAVATSGLSIVARQLLERLSTSGDPCAQVLADGSEVPGSGGFAPIESLRRVLRGPSKGLRAGAEGSAPTSVLEQER